MDQDGAPNKVETAATTDPLIGQVIDGRYEVLAHLGKGGMGSVYRVREIGTGSEYALKMIAPELAEKKILAKRLEHEALAAKTLTHANIVSIYDVGVADNQAPYLIMDLIEGQGLDEILNKEVLLPSKRALDIFIQIAEALVHADYKGVVHRDLKPSNILLTKTESGQDIVKIVDFGIAKISDTHTADKTKLTQTGELIGSPLYMSPEQCTGDELDGRSDIYSLGCIMYEVLAGRPAFADANPVKILLKHIGEAPPELSKTLQIKPELKSVVMRCLEKSASDRYETPNSLLVDLERIRDGRPIQKFSKKRKFDRKQLIGIACATILLIGCAIGVVVTSSMNKPKAPEVPIAIDQRPERYEGKTLAQWTAEIEKSGDAMAYFGRAKLHDIRDERTNAIDDFSSVLLLEPDFIEAFERRAMLYAAVNKFDEGLADVNKIIMLNPKSDLGYSSRAFLYLAMEKFDRSIADARRAIEISNSPHDYYILANGLMKLAEYDAAEKAINRAIELGKDYNALPSYEGVAGMIATFKHDYPKALEHLKRATEGGGRGAEWQELAYYYVAVGDMANAERAMRQAKVLETFPARGFRLSGEIYRTAGEYSKAVQEFSASTSLEEYAPGYRERAITYLKSGQIRSAAADIKKAFALNSESPITVALAAILEDKADNIALASEYYFMAFDRGTVPPIVDALRAEYHLQKNDPKMALEYANQAVKRDPWLKEGYEIRARVYEKIGQTNAAKSDTEKASKLISHLDL